MLSVAYLDIDYDIKSSGLVVAAYWDSGPGNNGDWNDHIQNTRFERHEIGVLTQDKADAAEDVGLGGWLVVIGQDDKPSMAHLHCFSCRRNDGEDSVC